MRCLYEVLDEVGRWSRPALSRPTLPCGIDRIRRQLAVRGAAPLIRFSRIHREYESAQDRSGFVAESELFDFVSLGPTRLLWKFRVRYRHESPAGGYRRGLGSMRFAQRLVPLFATGRHGRLVSDGDRGGSRRGWGM